MSDEVMKSDDTAPDYRKAMLYHSDRADEFMAQRDEALRAFAAEREKVARLVDAGENVAIAYGMGWDMDGVMEVLRAALASVQAQEGEG